jgi:hypothetical protein
MAGSRTLKLSILADVDDLKKKLATANGDVEDSAGKLEKFGQMAGAAFAAAAAAAAAYATKIAIDGVKAAIEDQAAQERLARTLESTTGATKDQIKAVEDQITKTQLATGVADDQLRPALSRLTIATSDLKKSQELLNLALDISAATGKPLEAVTNALAKSYEGSNTALSKLGVGLTSAELKTMSFQQVQQNLTDLFGGAAATQAETYQGQIARLTQRFNETKESIGTALLPIIQKMMDFVLNEAIPQFKKFKETAIDPVVDSIMKNKDAFIDLYNFIKDYIFPIVSTVGGAFFKTIGSIASAIVDIVATAIRAIEPIINAAIDGINLVIRAINLVKPGPDIASVAKINFSSSSTTSASQFVKSQPSTSIATTNFAASLPSVPSSASTSAADTSSQMATVGEAVQNATVGVALSQMAKNALPTIQNYINVTGAIDPESTARQIIDLLNQSDARGTGGAGMLRYNTQMI